MPHRVGGGAVDEEFRAFGLGVRSPRDKVDGLAEAIRILRGVWSQPSFSFQGRLYRTDGAELQPKREHPIPIWLGTYGRRPADVSERLGSFVELGFTAMNFMPVGPDSAEQAERLAKEVLPAVRAAG